MISPVASSPAHTQPAPQSQAARPQSQPKAQPATDTVRLNTAKAVVQEATETSVQTAREAASGDIQAKNLLARQAAAKVHAK